jgi:cytoskeletal protein RodZ
MKRNISDILRNSGDKAIEKIAGSYTAADKKTAQRIYSKSMEKMNLSADNSEVFIAEQVKHSPVLRPVLIVAACFFVICGAVFGLLKMKAPSPKPFDEEPVIVATATTVTNTETVTAENADTTETTAVKTEDTGTRKADTETTKADAKQADNVKITAPAKTNTTKATATGKRTTKTTAKTTTAKPATAPKISETTANTSKRMTLAEIEEWERSHWACVMTRERAILDGKISADSPRITLAQVKQIIAESSDFDEMYRKIRNIQPYYDINGGSGVNLIEYWVSGSRNDIVMVCPENQSITRITCTDGDIYGDSAKRVELYSEKQATKIPDNPVKSNYAGELTVNDVLKLAQKGQNLRVNDFRDYCYSANSFKTSGNMRFIISDRDEWYLVVEKSGNSDVLAVCNVVDNTGDHSIDIIRNTYNDVLNSINEWSLSEAVIAAPTAGTITLDDVVRLHNEKGEDLAPWDFSPYLNSHKRR